MIIHNKEVKGALDRETRCNHYHEPNDRIAIKFYCCHEYFSCVACHHEFGCGKPKVWPYNKFDEKAVLCGSCGIELTIKEYLESESTCPKCLKSFNPGCTVHYHYYFEM